MSKDIRVIDIFSHIIPNRYREELCKKGDRSEIDAMATHQVNPALYDLDMRLKVMEKYEDMRQVLTINSPALETVVGPADAVELARLANDRIGRVWPDKQRYFQMFHVDTALSGNTAGMMCGYECFGAGQMLFGSDAPYGDPGPIMDSVERMDIPAGEKRKIFVDNARELLRI